MLNLCILDINYFHCQKIVKILETTESDSKNFFGQYGSQRMKDWKEILRMYEKDNTYLGEVASLLLRNVNYEIPALRKQIQKTVQQQNVSLKINLKKSHF